MISVALGTCQGERWIGAQLESILAQLDPADEIVLADASSTDRTLEIARDLCGDRLRVIDKIRRGDIPATFEAALRQCRGDIVFLSDQDDVWLPGKVGACRAALGSKAVLALHDARVVDSEDRVLSESFLSDRHFRPGYRSNLLRPGYLGCAVAFRRELLATALPFPARLPMHDWWLGLLAERTGGVAVLRKPLILHRRHGGNANYDVNRSPYSAIERMGFRWRMWLEVERRLRVVA